MAECIQCKTETQLYDSGVPICIKCSKQREVTRKPPSADQQIRAMLLQNVLEATSRNNDATREFEAVMGQFPSGLPHPDGAQRIKSASDSLSIARKDLMEAHTRLNDYIGRGIVPDNLRRSG